MNGVSFIIHWSFIQQHKSKARYLARFVLPDSQFSSGKKWKMKQLCLKNICHVVSAPHPKLKTPRTNFSCWYYCNTFAFPRQMQQVKEWQRLQNENNSESIQPLKNLSGKVGILQLSLCFPVCQVVSTFWSLVKLSSNLPPNNSITN